MKQTNFWLIRHALVEENARAFLYGVMDVPLCETTLLEQAPMYRSLAARLPRLDVLLDTTGEQDPELARDLARLGRGRLRQVRSYRDVAPALSEFFDG